MQLVNKGLLGAIVSIGIHIAAKSRFFFIAGLLPLFPAFALIAHWSVGQERGLSDLRVCIIFTMLSLIPYAAYLISMLVCIERYSLGRSLMLSSIIWLVFAAALIIAWQLYGIKSL